MSPIKKMLLGVLIVFVVIQFIQPARNKNGQVLAADISKMYSLPENVQATLKTACYDCHSNNTQYPWYVNIQPAGWMLARHIKQGKAELNFSEFG
ncbi:heme-binding domain-containing protein, partial [Niastella vici]|uniref:heme-binding domain-containing protein n=1 Tax=Niastella vici TaxID=1703345 RepID=UPI00156EB179